MVNTIPGQNYLSWILLTIIFYPNHEPTGLPRIASSKFWMTRACLILNGEHFCARGRVYGWGKLKRVALFSWHWQHCQCRQVTSFSAGKLLSPSPSLSKWTSNIIWIKNLRTCSMIKQPTFLWHHHFFPLQNDIWETTVEIPYWWHVTTQIWVVLLIGWKFASTH